MLYEIVRPVGQAVEAIPNINDLITALIGIGIGGLLGAGLNMFRKTLLSKVYKSRK